MEKEFENIEVLDNTENIEVENIENTLDVEDAENVLHVEDDDTLFVDSGIISADDIFKSMRHAVHK